MDQLQIYKHNQKLIIEAYDRIATHEKRLQRILSHPDFNKGFWPFVSSSTKELKREKKISEEIIKKASSKIETLEPQQDPLCVSYLEKNDTNFQSLIEENRELMANPNILFKRVQEDYSIMGSYATELKGELKSNGYLYCNKSATNMALMAFEDNRYPTHYRGKINYRGELELKVTKTEYTLVGGRLPSSFKGSIDHRGNVELELSNSEWEWDGHSCISRLVADIFCGNDKDYQKFKSNLVEMDRILEEFKSELIGQL